MNKMLFLSLLTFTTPTLAAHLPKKMDCKYNGSHSIDFTLTRNPMRWRVDYLDGAGKSRSHHYFVNSSLRPHRLSGFHFGSRKDEEQAVWVKISIDGKTAFSTEDGLIFSGSHFISQVLLELPNHHEQQRQETQYSLPFTCVAR